MSSKATWIKEIAKEINHSEASLKRAIKDTGMEINYKYDILVCYAKWSVPKLKNVEMQEASYKTKIEELEQLIYELQRVMLKMRNDFDGQLERKDQLIETQNEIIAIMSEMQDSLRDLPLASGE